MNEQLQIGPRRTRLPDVRRSVIHSFTIHATPKKFKCSCGEEIVLFGGDINIYLTIGFYPDNRPGELFVKASEYGEAISGLVGQWSTAVSIGLQYGVPLQAFCEKGIHTRFQPAGQSEEHGHTDAVKKRIASSIIDGVCHWLYYNVVSPEERLLPPEGFVRGVKNEQDPSGSDK